MALTRQEAQGMIDVLEQPMAVRINGFVMAEGQPIKDAIHAHNKVIATHRETFQDLEQRISNVVEQQSGPAAGCRATIAYA